MPQPPLSIKIFFACTISILLLACSSTKPAIAPATTSHTELLVKQTAEANPNIIQSKKTANNFAYKIEEDSLFAQAHIGVCVYNTATDSCLYSFNADKYFIPSSNVKIATCYAAMKHLGDSIVGLMYKDFDSLDLKFNRQQPFILYATGDPTFLHPLFKNQPVYSFIKNIKNDDIAFCSIHRTHRTEVSEDVLGFGKGWSWDDYNEEYMAERSQFPIYGNVATISLKDSLPVITPSFYQDELNNKLGEKLRSIKVVRDVSANRFKVYPNEKYAVIKQLVPIKLGYSTKSLFGIEYGLLEDTLKRSLRYGLVGLNNFDGLKTVYSQPTDSVLKPMMHHSDNFFAEQMLLMVSLKMLYNFNDEGIIDTLLKTDFVALPQKPRWVDGSGLSRYNLFTPHDFVFILNKMKKEFSWQRIQNIFPTANQGTLKNNYRSLTNIIYAKTGSISNNISLSGYLITKQNKVLAFSIIVNNHQAKTAAIKQAFEKFLQQFVE